MEFANSSLVFLDKLLILVPLLDARVLEFLFALSNNTFGFHDVVVDVTSDVLIHTLNLLKLALLELLLCCLFASGFLFPLS